MGYKANPRGGEGAYRNAVTEFVYHLIRDEGVTPAQLKRAAAQANGGATSFSNEFAGTVAGIIAERLTAAARNG